MEMSSLAVEFFFFFNDKHTGVRPDFSRNCYATTGRLLFPQYERHSIWTRYSRRERQHTRGHSCGPAAVHAERLVRRRRHSRGAEATRDGGGGHHDHGIGARGRPSVTDADDG